MEIVEQSEAFAENPQTNDFEFSHTKIILKNNDRYYYATTKGRLGPKTTVDLQALDAVPIPPSHIWPQFPLHFTQAPIGLPEHDGSYTKRPNLLTYGDSPDTTEVRSILLEEAEKCEILRKHPHPNIAKYFGCVVHDGRITGLCFLKYEMSLLQRLKDPRSFDAKRCMKQIEAGVQHLHNLDLVHCDINPYNVMMDDGDTPVIIDFDSCRRKGDKLGMKAGTMGWTNEDFELARPENDFYGIEKIREFIDSGKY
ncbi:hypothetical protein SLS56_004359 [Neofusicoccum ribis]|uniref:Protein kinase domain-containing protein n=1 Tax=Neofusicoccum ribis TaxID=45134 RepID=A0ABR3SWI1_9PEZI